MVKPFYTVSLVFAIKLSKIHLKLDYFDLESKLIQLKKTPELASIKKFISEIIIEDVYPAILNDKKNLSRYRKNTMDSNERLGEVYKKGDTYLSPVEKEIDS